MRLYLAHRTGIDTVPGELIRWQVSTQCTMLHCYLTREPSFMFLNVIDFEGVRAA
jgi:hypothetical protein